MLVILADFQFWYILGELFLTNFPGFFMSFQIRGLRLSKLYTVSNSTKFQLRSVIAGLSSLCGQNESDSDIDVLNDLRSDHGSVDS